MSLSTVGAWGFRGVYSFFDAHVRVVSEASTTLCMLIRSDMRKMFTTTTMNADA